MINLLIDAATLKLGLSTTVLGFGLVFFVLILISIVLIIFGKVMSASSKNEEKPKTVVPVNVINKEPVAEPEVDLIYDKELVAVITAAIAASMGENVGPDKLVVRSLRRVKKSSWKNEAIHEQQNSVF